MAYFADAEATRRWWEAHDWLCDCCYCENYRRAFPDVFPEGEAMLTQWVFPSITRWRFVSVGGMRGERPECIRPIIL